MIEPRFKFEVAETDLAFIKGLETITREVKVPKGQPYILHTSDHVISIINHEDRWGYEHLYAVNVTAIGGYDGVYADSEDEAIYFFADYCAEQVPDPDNEGQTKMRYPGLIQTWMEIVEDVGEEAFENYSGDYSGAWGNEGWYFTEHGHSPTAELVHDPKIPPIPDDLFPYTFEAEESEEREESIKLAYYYLAMDIRLKHGDHEWHGFLVDYIYDNMETKFKASVHEHEGDGLVNVVISVAE